MATLWMGDVPPMATEDMIMAAFASHHEHPVAVKMGRNLVSSGNGYCFVTFSSADHAEKVLLNLNGKPIINVAGMQRFKLNYAAHKAGNQNRTPFGNVAGGQGYNGGYQAGRSSRTNHSVYVGNLAQNISNKALFDLFSTKCPETILSAHTYLDQQGTKRFGFVNFVDESEIDKALTLDGSEYLSCGEGVPIRVNKTNDRNKSSSYNSQQHQYSTADYSPAGMGDYSGLAAAAYAYDPSSWYNPAAAAGAYNMYYNNPAWAAAAMQQQGAAAYAAAAATAAGGAVPATAFPGAYPPGAAGANPAAAVQTGAAAAGPYGAATHGALQAVSAAQNAAAAVTAQQLSQVAGMTTQVPQNAIATTSAAVVSQQAAAVQPNGQATAVNQLGQVETSEHELVPTDVHRAQDEFYMNRQAINRDEATYEYLERCRWISENFGPHMNLLAVPYGSVF